MDVSYERNVATLLTTIITNSITMALLGTVGVFKDNEHSDEKLLGERDNIQRCLESLVLLLILPVIFVSYAARSLCRLIKYKSVGMPYKYIRLLPNARYFIGYDTQNKFNKPDGSIQLPTLWLPKYWPKKVKEVKRLRLLTLPAKRYISDPTFDGFYCMKSSMGCLFGAVQCVSAIIMSCMRLQNIDTMHTMDVISMFSSYMLLCMVIHAACGPAYYCKPVVCLPKLQLGIYEKINNELSFRKLRLCIHWFFDKNWAKILVFLLLSTPICLMVILLIYINRNNTLLLSLSIVWILFVAVISPLIFLLCLLFLSEKLFFFQATIPPVLLIILIVCSCLVVTPEQKYPNSVNWLPHF